MFNRLQRLLPLAAAGLLLLPGCSDAPGGVEAGRAEKNGEPSRGQRIARRAIAAHGGSILDSAVVSFTFRGDRFRAERRGGAFSYARTYRDSSGRRVREVLTSDSLYRTMSGQRVRLSPQERRTVETRLNSVVYFALLPSFLDDPAVQTEYTGPDTIAGVPYHRVAVSFQKEGGGRDWQDRFLYWFRQKDYAMDYLAYAFGLGSGEEETGTRFREAFNVRRVGGVRFADYRNYAADTLGPSNLDAYPRLLDTEALRLVSTIAIDSVQVRSLAKQAAND